MSDVTLTLVESTPVVLEFSSGVMTTNLFATFIEAYFDGLDEYDSDESAADGGVAVGKYYKTASNHVEGMGGVIKERLI